MDRWIRVGLPAGLGILLTWYLISGQIFLFVHERSIWLIALSVPVLLAMAFAHRRPSRDPGPDRLTVALLALPLVVGLLVPARPLGAAAIDAQGVSAAPQATTSGTNGGWDPVPSFTIDARNAVWDIRALARVQASDRRLQGFEGQRASLLGFVYRGPTTPADQFLVSRFVIRCCTADAVAFFFPVRYDHAAELARDTWVEVQGRIQSSGTPGSSDPLLVAEQVRVVPQPAQPYLYP